MTHYQVLGVRPDAPAEELRRAYLRQARRHHPDRQHDAGDRRRSEQRMRDLNAAWAVLRDPARRAAYDAGLRAGPGIPGVPAPTVAGERVVHSPSRDFTPFHAEDADDDDAWRYEPDEYDPDTAVGRWLSMGPTLLLALGLLLGFGGLLLGQPGRGVLAGGLIALLLGGAGFLLVPLVAMGRSQTTERRREDARRRQAVGRGARRR